MAKRGTLILIFFLLCVLGTAFWPGTKSRHVTVDILHGMTAHQVADQLLEKNGLRSRWPFLFWVKLRNVDAKIKVGRYTFRLGRSAFWIVHDLARGATTKIQIVIPEGFASWQIAERLEKQEICLAEPFLEIVKKENLEGFLFPATYDLDLGLSPGDVARFLRNEFDRHWTPKLAARAEEIGWTKLEAVTMASIIEREVMVEKEMPLVSALYNNRLRLGKNLEADPTVQYAMGYWKSRLLYADYRETISPYNTYLHKGLPPGPICSPGLKAIEAALWPAESNALYMVSKGDGTHDFSQTYRQHVNKVNRRNRLRRQQKKK